MSLISFEPASSEYFFLFLSNLTFNVQLYSPPIITYGVFFAASILGVKSFLWKAFLSPSLFGAYTFNIVALKSSSSVNSRLMSQPFLSFHSFLSYRWLHFFNRMATPLDLLQDVFQKCLPPHSVDHRYFSQCVSCNSKMSTFLFLNQ
jgi:hypothetical protein